MKLIKTTASIYILYMIALLLIYASFLGPLPATGYIVLTVVTGLLVITAISMIPFVQKMVSIAEKWIAERIQALAEHKREAAKLAAIILADAVIARIITSQFKVYVFTFAVLWLCSMIVFYHKMIAQKAEVAVFLFIMTIGTVYVTTLPASLGISWDDEIHYSMPLVMSHLFDRELSDADDLILESFPETALDHKNYSQKQQLKWYDKVDTAYEEGGLIDTVRSLPRYKKLVYVPSATGLLIGRALQLPYHMTFMLGRWCNLWLYAIVIYLAIRRLKAGKMLAAVVAMLPPNIFMASSYSYDPWMTAFLMYGFCIFVGELQRPEKKMKIWDMILMVMAFFIGVGPKVLYIPMILILLFMPKEKFSNPKHYRRVRIATIIVLIIVGLLVLKTAFGGSGGIVQDTRGGTGVDAGAQISFILSNPGEYTKILLGFLGQYFSLESAQTYLNYLHYFGTAGYSLVTMLLLVVVTFTDKEHCDCNVRMLPRIATLVLSFGTICLVATSMYIAFTEVGSNTILGCQYRYILPFMFPVLYVLGSGRIENRMRREYYNGIVLALSSFVLLNAVWTLCINIY